MQRSVAILCGCSLHAVRAKSILLAVLLVRPGSPLPSAHIRVKSHNVLQHCVRRPLLS